MTSIFRTWWRNWEFGWCFGLPVLLWPAIIIGSSGITLMLAEHDSPAKHDLVTALLATGCACSFTESVRLCHSIYRDFTRRTRR